MKRKNAAPAGRLTPREKTLLAIAACVKFRTEGKREQPDFVIDRFVRRHNKVGSEL